MKKHRHVGTGLTAGAFFLIGTLAVAQTAPQVRSVRPRDAQSGQASGWQSQSNPAASRVRVRSHSNSSNNNKTLGSAHATESLGSSDNSAAEVKPGSGTAQPQAARKDGAITQADFPRSNNARNSAHATESLSPSDNAKKGENPLYEDSGKSGTNPLYEGKSQANLKPGAGASAVPYKDPEDMTTRYRAGNNKTTRSAAMQGAGTAQQQKTVENPVGEMKSSDNSRSSAHATESLQKKHPGNVKYSDFNVSGNK